MSKEVQIRVLDAKIKTMEKKLRETKASMERQRSATADVVFLVIPMLEDQLEILSDIRNILVDA